MRRLLLILLVAPLSLGGVAYAVHAARTAPPLALSVSPAAQATDRASGVDFSVDVRRSRRFAGRVTLGVARLATGVRARWHLADGTPARVLPPGENGATLTLQSSRSTPTGARRAIVWAQADGQTARRRLTLTVIRPGRPGFSVTASPSQHVVPPGTAASYRIRIARTNGFRGLVRLRVLHVPRGVRASFVGGKLKLSTKSGSRELRHHLVVDATAQVHRRVMHRYAVIALSLVDSARFSITGDLSTKLFPGARAPLDLLLTNPHDVDLRITALQVSLRPDTSNPGCPGDGGFTVEQFGGSYPLVLAPGSAPLSALVPDPSLWPQIAMRDLPTNQDACKNAVLGLEYSGTATR